MAVDKENAKFIFDYEKRDSIKLTEVFKELSVQAIEYLNKLDNAEKVFEDQNAFNALFFICQTIIYIDNKQLLAIYDSKNCVGLFVKIFKYFHKVKKDLTFKNVFRYNQTTSETSDDKRSTIFLILLLGTNYYTMYSMNFCKKFLKKGGLKYWIEIVRDLKFIEKNKDILIRILSFVINPIEIIILSIANMSRTCEEEKKIWIELDTITFLLKMCQVKSILKGNSFHSIINIADDNQLENLPEMNNVKLFIVDRLRKMVECFKTGNLNRHSTQMNIGGESINCYDVYYLDDQEKILFSLILQLKLFYKLTINKKMRNELYYEDKIMETLQIILLKGNYFERYFALEIIAQLTFDEKISSELNKTSDFKGILEKLKKQIKNENASEDEKKAFQGVKEFIQRIYWNLEDKVIETENTEKAQHIMISYNSASKKLCIKIKEYLEDKCKQNVWIDVSEIHGSSLDSMTKAVEGAWCVLMCVTEKYRQSVNCQAEAKYAFALNKKIIPVIMQEDYNLQGWLGIIKSDKIHVNCLLQILVIRN